MKKFQNLSLITFAVICFSVLPLYGSVPAVLEQMPSDAAVVIATQPLKILNARASSYAQKLGLPIPPDQPMDLGMKLSEQLGMSGQLDSTKGIGISIGNIMQAEQTMVVYLPILNAENTLTSLGATKNEAAPGIWSLPAQQSFAKTAGSYLMIAPDSMNLTNISNQPRGVKLSASDQALFERSDVAIKAQLGPVMGMAKMMIPGLLMNNPQMQQYPAATQLVNLVMDRLAEVDKGSLGLSLGQNGVNLGVHLQARPGSQLAGYFSNHPPTDISELAVLPPGNFSTAYAFNYNGEVFRPCLDSIFATLANDPGVTEKVGAESLTELQSLLNYKMDIKGAFAEYTTSSTTNGGKKMLGVTSNSNLDKMLEVGEKACPLITKIIAQFGFDMPVVYKSKAGTTAGMSYDEVSVDMSKFTTDPMALEAMKKQWGDSLSFTEQFCKLDSTRAAIAVGDGSLEEIVNFVKSGQAGLDQDPAIRTAAKSLPANANVYAFIHVGNAVRSMLATAPPQMMMLGGMFTQVQGVAGVAMTMDDGRIETEIHVPDDVIQSVGMMIQQMMMMMQPQPTPGA